MGGMQGGGRAIAWEEGEKEEEEEDLIPSSPLFHMRPRLTSVLN